MRGISKYIGSGEVFQEIHLNAFWHILHIIIELVYIIAFLHNGCFMLRYH